MIICNSSKHLEIIIEKYSLFLQVLLFENYFVLETQVLHFTLSF